MEFLLVAAALVAFVAFRVAQAQSFRRAMLRRILDRVEGSFVPSRWPFSDEVSGTHEGRKFRLWMSTNPSHRRYPIRAQVELLHAPSIQLRVRRDQGLAAVEKALGLVRDVEVSGGDRFDQRYLVEANEAPVQAPLADREVRDAIHDLLTRWDLDEVFIARGELHVSGETSRAGQQLLSELLFHMATLAHAYDRRPALEIGLQQRFLWVGGEGTRARCPFCHDAIGDLGDLVACDGCQTLLHEECHHENGGCPILGCGGRGMDRVGPISLKE